MVKKKAVLVIGILLMAALATLILVLALRDRGLMGSGVTFVRGPEPFYYE